MAQIVITIPDAVLGRVVDGLCAAYSYQATLYDADGNATPNPVTKSAFAKQTVIRFIVNAVKGVEAQAAENTARDTAIADAESKLKLT